MNLLGKASQLSSLPILNKLAPSATLFPSDKELEGYLKCQRLALKAAKEIAKELQPGWTEKRAAKMLETYLRDEGVEAFFHFPFAWWGDRSKFVGVKHYYSYLPSDRVLQENEPFILDVAPILNGFIADIGYSGCLGVPSEEWLAGQNFLFNLREAIPDLFTSKNSGGDVWNDIDSMIVEAGYENIHKKYPFSVLGHRVHKAPKNFGQMRFIHFGWQSYWAFSARGIFGQLLNQNFSGDLNGLWAIEPHIGTSSFGAKFEEILCVKDGKAFWLEQEMSRESW